MKLDLSRHAVHPGKVIKVRIENDSDGTVVYGLPFSLQRYEDGRWVKLPEQPVFLPAFWLEPGAVGEWQAIRIPANAEPGRYRVRKTVSLVDSSRREEAAVYGYFSVCSDCVLAGDVPRKACRGATEVDYEAPLGDLPPLPGDMSTDSLGMGPSRLRLKGVGDRLNIERSEFGFELAVDRQTIRRRVALDGYTELKLDRVNRRGGVVETVVARRQGLGVVASPAFNGKSFLVDVPAKPGLYRFDAWIRDAKGAAVDRYADYLRVLRPVTDVRLMTHRVPYGPGALIHFWVENRGTREVDPLGNEFAIEVFDGASWAKAPISPRVFPKSRAKPLVAGAVGGCTYFSIPRETQPGLYRFSKDVVLETGARRELTAQFEVSLEADRLTPKPQSSGAASGTTPGLRPSG